MHIKKAKLDQTIFLVTIFAIPVLNFLIFWVYLNFSSITLAFQNVTGDGEVVWSLSNYRALFTFISMKGSIFWVALKNTALYWVFSSIIAYFLAFPVSYFFFKKIRGYKFFRFVVFLPTLISATVLTSIFKQVIAANGPVGALLAAMGKDYIPFLSDDRYAIWTCLFYSVLFGFGGNTLVISGAMSQIGDSLIEAGKIDGTNLWTELTKIVIPMVWPTMSAIFIQAIAGFFNASGPILLLTEGQYGTWTINYWIYQQVYGATNYYFPAAVGLFFAVLSLPLTFFSKWLLKRRDAAEDKL